MEVEIMLRREKGFTLIELLIVVAIIGIIAAIAVPNLLAAIQRSKRSRTAADVRAIGTGLGSYVVDYNFFPRDDVTTMFSILEIEGFYSGATKDGWNQMFVYATDTTGAESYSLWSYGKNMVFDYTNSEFDSDIAYFNGQFTAPSVLTK